MPAVKYSERFAKDFSEITSAKVEKRVLKSLENIEHFPELGSLFIPESIKNKYGSEVRKVALNPFDLIYSYYPQENLIQFETLIYQRLLW